MKQEKQNFPEKLLLMTDSERRKYAGGRFLDWLKEKGLAGVIYLGNIEDALPPAVRPALTAHGVPPEAYQGRMLGMSLGLMLPEQPKVVLNSPPFLSEIQFWGNLCTNLGIPMPEIVQRSPNEKEFVYPFIGSPNMNREFPKRTIPDASRFNNKAYMRGLARQLGLESVIVPGIEIIYDGQNPQEFAQSSAAIIQRYRERHNPNIIVKLGNTASGLLSVSLTEKNQPIEMTADELLKAIMRMFSSHYDSILYPGDLVIEELIDFGSQEDGIGDFSIRGFLTPQGEAVVFSIGRVVSDQKGEYLGMVMAKTNDLNQLSRIGLSQTTLNQAVKTFSELVTAIYKEGYFGPVSFDFFAGQNELFTPILVHDYNIREGGTSISGFINSVSESIWGKTDPTLDIELQLIADYLLTEGQIEKILEFLLQKGIIPYATSFLSFPKTINDERIYTLKVLSPCRVKALTNAQVAGEIRNLTSQLNQDPIMPGIRFSSPL